MSYASRSFDPSLFNPQPSTSTLHYSNKRSFDTVSSSSPSSSTQHLHSHQYQQQQQTTHHYHVTSRDKERENHHRSDRISNPNILTKRAGHHYFPSKPNTTASISSHSSHGNGDGNVASTYGHIRNGEERRVKNIQGESDEDEADEDEELEDQVIHHRMKQEETHVPVVTVVLPPEEDEDETQVKKRSRTLTTAHQTAVLTALFAKTRFPSTETREEVGVALGMSGRRVQIWLQNRRQAQKRARDIESLDPATSVSASASASDSLSPTSPPTADLPSLPSLSTQAQIQLQTSHRPSLESNGSTPTINTLRSTNSESTMMPTPSQPYAPSTSRHTDYREHKRRDSSSTINSSILLSPVMSSTGSSRWENNGRSSERYDDDNRDRSSYKGDRGNLPSIGDLLGSTHHPSQYSSSQQYPTSNDSHGSQGHSMERRESNGFSSGGDFARLRISSSHSSPRHSLQSQQHLPSPSISHRYRDTDSRNRNDRMQVDDHVRGTGGDEDILDKAMNTMRKSDKVVLPSRGSLPLLYASSTPSHPSNSSRIFPSASTTSSSPRTNGSSASTTRLPPIKSFYDALPPMSSRQHQYPTSHSYEDNISSASSSTSNSNSQARSLDSVSTSNSIHNRYYQEKRRPTLPSLSESLQSYSTSSPHSNNYYSRQQHLSRYEEEEGGSSSPLSPVTPGDELHLFSHHPPPLPSSSSSSASSYSQQPRSTFSHQLSSQQRHYDSGECRDENEGEIRLIGQNYSNHANGGTAPKKLVLSYGRPLVR